MKNCHQNKCRWMPCLSRGTRKVKETQSFFSFLSLSLNTKSFFHLIFSELILILSSDSDSCGMINRESFVFVSSLFWQHLLDSGLFPLNFYFVIFLPSCSLSSRFAKRLKHLSSQRTASGQFSAPSFVSTSTLITSLSLNFEEREKEKREGLTLEYCLLIKTSGKLLRKRKVIAKSCLVFLMQRR